MGKKGVTGDLQSSFRIATKNLKKFTVIYYQQMQLCTFFHIFLSDRALLRKYLLIVCFSPCYLNGKLRAYSLIQTNQIGPSHHMECLKSHYALMH